MNEEFLKLISNIPDTFYRADLDGRMLFVSPNVENWLGYSAKELIGLRLADFYLEEEQVQQFLQLLAEGDGQITNFCTPLRRKDGSAVWVSTSVAYFYDDFGNVCGREGVVRDITIEHEQQLELAQHRERLEAAVFERTVELKEEIFRTKQQGDMLQLVIDNMPQAVFWKDRNSNFLGCNKALARDFGLARPADIIGKNAYDLSVTPEEAAAYHIDDQRVMSAGEPLYHIRETSQKPDGSKLELDTSKIPLRDINGEVIGVLCTYEDITERKKIAIERDRLLQAIDQSGETIVITDISGTITYVNPAFEQITGYTRDEAIGQNPRILKSGEHDEAFYQKMWETLTCGMIWRGQLRNIKKDGTIYIEDAVISPVCNPPGTIVNFVAVKRDVTEMQQFQEEILKKTRLASLGELAAGVAHEINNPNALNLYNSDIIATILNDLLPWFKKNQPDQSRLFGGLSYNDALDEFQTLLSAIQGSGLRIKRIVDDLRDFCRQDDADFNEVVDLNQVVSTSARLVGNIIKQATDHFEINLSASLPMINGVGGRLEQVVINLLLNSCQALYCRTQKISLATKYVESSNHVQVVIVDEGCGMPPEVVDHILEPFVTTKRDQGGSGLGLSVSNRIVGEHHGELQISSSEGEGTVIIMILPVSHEVDNVD